MVVSLVIIGDFVELYISVPLYDFEYELYFVGLGYDSEACLNLNYLLKGWDHDKA